MKSIISDSPEATTKLGMQLSNTFSPKAIVNIIGDLGVGKTTLVRGILQGLGVAGEITSPTYDLLETYNINNKNYCHIDLFRCKSPHEWMEAGINDAINDSDLTLIEWPEKAQGLPKPDVIINIIDMKNNPREINILTNA